MVPKEAQGGLHGVQFLSADRAVIEVPSKLPERIRIQGPYGIQADMFTQFGRQFMVLHDGLSSTTDEPH
jgi:hypothetical protein